MPNLLAATCECRTIHLDPETESPAVHGRFSKTLEAVLCREIWSHRGNPNIKLNSTIQNHPMCKKGMKTKNERQIESFAVCMPNAPPERKG